jgi:hypothetical protein
MMPRSENDGDAAIEKGDGKLRYTSEVGSRRYRWIGMHSHQGISASRKLKTWGLDFERDCPDLHLKTADTNPIRTALCRLSTGLTPPPWL